MSLVDDLIEAGLKASSDPAWVEELTEQARPYAAQIESPLFREAAGIALDAISARADRVAHLGAQGLVAVTAAWSVGGADAAKRAYLRHHASMGELLDAADAIDAQALRERGMGSWGDLLEVLEDVASALPHLVPVLMAAL